MKSPQGRCPVHGTVVCPRTGNLVVAKDCRECQVAIRRIREGRATYVAEKRLEEHLLDRALKGVRKSLRHAYAGG